MRWSQLPPARVDSELSKLGITMLDLEFDAEDVPELKARLDLLPSREARQYAVLEYFGDQEHPQPTARTPDHVGYMPPDWGRLPRLEDDRPDVVDTLRRRDALPKGKRGTDEYPRRVFHEIARLLEQKVPKRQIANKTGISRQRVDTVEKWLLDNGRDYEVETRPDNDTVILRLR